jgi:hypothetical protein
MKRHRGETAKRETVPGSEGFLVVTKTTARGERSQEIKVRQRLGFEGEFLGL